MERGSDAAILLRRRRRSWLGNQSGLCHDGRMKSKSAMIPVTKRDRPMATRGPVRKRMSSEGRWKGKVHIPEEELTAGTSDLWDIVRKK
jgi:hypothetical protein